MSSTFIPSDAVNMNKERDWAANLGMLDWDSTRIVFTKRSLIEFLKYTGTTVDPNFTNVSKLPKYAVFGTLKEGGSAEAAASAAAGEVTPAATATPEQEAESSASGAFRPTRRVRTAPGGDTHDIFGLQADNGALAQAPPPRVEQVEPKAEEPEHVVAQDDYEGDHHRSDSREEKPSKGTFRPTRRVREMPGGRDSIADIL